MHPIILHIIIPKSWHPYFGPQSPLFSWWPIIAAIFAVAFLTWLWATSPSQDKYRRLIIWIAAVISLSTGLFLLGIGLVQLGEIKLHTYGLMLSTGFLVGIALAVREARRVGENPEVILDLTFWILIASIVGSRVLYIIISWHEYTRDFGKLFRIWEGGLVFYGGLLGAIIVSVWFIKSYSLNFWKIADILIPSVSLGQCFGRLGCFSSGCCYGKPAYTIPWAVTFTDGLAPHNIPLHPTQLYESLGDLFIFFALIMLRTRKRFHGQILIAYLLLYSSLRFAVELFRGDAVRGFLFKYDLFPFISGVDILSSSQLVSLILFSVGLILFAILYVYNSQKALQPTDAIVNPDAGSKAHDSDEMADAGSKAYDSGEMADAGSKAHDSGEMADAGSKAHDSDEMADAGSKAHDSGEMADAGSKAHDSGDTTSHKQT
jgi:phosphatidylglycerol:prolipoprotein diacylglycerol transferase